MHKTKKKLGRGIFEILQARENTGGFKKTSISTDSYKVMHPKINRVLINYLLKRKMKLVHQWPLFARTIR